MKIKLIFCVLALLVQQVWSDDGRMEISQDLLPFNITESGSYVLTENLITADADDAITIQADNVSIDLNGFHVVGLDSDEGIVADGNRKNITILNGTVRDWNVGIDLSLATNCFLKNIRVTDNDNSGMKIGGVSSVIECSAINNGSVSEDHGFEVGNAVLMVNCVSRGNVGNGYLAGEGSSLDSCLSRENSGTGIEVGSGSSVRGCNVRSNNDDGIVAGASSHISESVVYSNDNGIRMQGAGGLVINCTAFGNRENGFNVTNGNSVIQCVAYDNNTGFRAAGSSFFAVNNAVNNTNRAIWVTGDDCRLEMNHVVNSAVGIDIDGSNNLLIRNSATDCTTEYTIVGGNKEAPQVSAPGTADPWDNFNY